MIQFGKTHKENQKLNDCQSGWQCYNTYNIGSPGQVKCQQEEVDAAFEGSKEKLISIVFEESSNVFPSILKIQTFLPNVFFFFSQNWY